MLSRLTPPVSKIDHQQGSDHAIIELVEFGDFQCPHCGAAHPIIKRIQKVFGEQLKFIFRHFPLSNVHEWAIPAAISSEAAGRQNKFWEMHDMIFENQSSLGRDAFLDFAATLRMNITRFQADLHDDSLAATVEADFESGVRSGVNGTPTFYINRNKYPGGYDFDSLAGAIEIVSSEIHHHS